MNKKLFGQDTDAPIDGALPTASNGDDDSPAGEDHADDNDDFLDEFGVSDEDLTMAVKEQAIIPVEKPKKGAFFQTHKSMFKLIYALKNPDDGKLLLATKRLAANPHLAEHIGVYKLVPTLDRAGNVRVWPIRQARAGETSYPAWDSSQSIAERAKEKLLRISWNPSISAYDTYVAPIQPAAPVWPELDMDTIVSMAFEGHKITSEDHPVVRRLLGLE